MEVWQFVLSLALSAFCGAAIPVLGLWVGVRVEMTGLKATMKGNHDLVTDQVEQARKALDDCERRERTRLDSLNGRLRELERG